MEGVEETIVGTGVAEPIFEGRVETIVFVTFATLILLESPLSVPSFPLITPPPALNLPPLYTFRSSTSLTLNYPLCLPSTFRFFHLTLMSVYMLSLSLKH